MKSYRAAKNTKVKTTILFEKNLLEEIDEFNPFQTRKEFLDQACKTYLKKIRRHLINKQLAKACSDAENEDCFVSEEWDQITLEGWQ
jgi:metal-responsive CopG/Arc/MetJ family transcriptional regulator